MYPEEHTEIDQLGVHYPRGDCLGIRDATIARNVKLLEKIKTYAPERKLKLIEFGSGRGGFAIQISQELDKIDRLEKFTATNISRRENEYNQRKAREVGLTEDKYEVEYMSFDELDDLADGSFDVICSNEAILYSQNKSKLMAQFCRILSQGGITVFTDILESTNAPKEVLQPIYERLDLKDLGTVELYNACLLDGGLTKIEQFTDTRNLTRHYGSVKYSTLGASKEELLGENGVGQEFYDKQVTGLGHWVEAGDKEMLEWGWFIYAKK